MTRAKTVMITGSSSGIGLALYHEYLSLGYQVIACGRDKEKLNQVNPEAVTKLAFDVTNPEAVLSAAQQVAELDILILNAGTCQYIDDAQHFNGQAFREVIETNLLAMGALLEGFLAKVVRGGQLALISSSATIIPFPRAQAYGASKAGLDYLANSLRVDLKSAGISVSLIHPGFVKTPLTDRNDFPMPFILTPKQAGKRIVQGLKQRKNYVHFPKRLTLLLKFLALFPQSLSSALLTKES
ncbi:SDR family NAD(P)-dependent oxidoreductase [Litorilituus sediminis]|uniref:SDR family NAD(P)-dependent oxidoreductase n=1 Tax=Litorilituus sediminis TaxID=718192 RepID=A0A4P6P6R2_9GAMM|nr:SDR family NAD(P)-dependent oxidoreductase [Litorilituus sediminis]QBG37311.1 SDR family NAD(P)-dependent oxidoreductase [Litorilituus sediminis]